MKRGDLLRHLRRHGCYLKREGASHSLWCNPTTGAVEAVPRHTEVANKLHHLSAGTMRARLRGLPQPKLVQMAVRSLSAAVQRQDAAANRLLKRVTTQAVGRGLG